MSPIPVIILFIVKNDLDVKTSNERFPVFTAFGLQYVLYCSLLNMYFTSLYRTSYFPGFLLPWYLFLLIYFAGLYYFSVLNDTISQD